MLPAALAGNVVSMPVEPSEPPERRPARVRTHLANERTFLAWMRTGLASIALGLGAAELLSDDRVLDIPINRAIAVVLIGFGMMLAVIGQARHRAVREQIDTDEWIAPRKSIDLVALGVFVVGIVSIVFALRSLSA